MTYYNVAQMYAALGDRKKEKEFYAIFLKKSDSLEDTEENREMVERIKTYLKM